ncbi:MAG: GIY-YIG nuclease family protein [Candidatus Doudnabacteria bacterium]|nr:GIY-YIG nuclease family protein [Candidatus Doudnabacteria bacterium]
MFYVYIMSSESGAIYIGFTSDLVKRVWEHRNGFAEGFTKKYKCQKLVYYESGEDYDALLAREKQIKKWGRFKKTTLISSINPKWQDLYKSII